MAQASLGVVAQIVIVSLLINTPISIKCNNWSLRVKNAKPKYLQKIVDNENLGAHFYYGEYDNEVFCDHSNQVFSHLKYVKVGDTLTVNYLFSTKKYECVAIEVMKVDSMGHIRDKDGLYMGDSYAPCTVLYTCQGKDRLVTIWKEVEK